MVSGQLAIQTTLQEWANGRVTLKDIKSYTNEELFSIAHIGYYFMMQGKYDDARTIFEGLVAVDPRNEYYYRALGVVFENLGEHDRALRQFGFSIRLAPALPYAYMNRAGIHILMKRWTDAKDDLQSVLDNVGTANPQMSKKAWALYKFVSTNL